VKGYNAICDPNRCSLPCVRNETHGSGEAINVVEGMYFPVDFGTTVEYRSIINPSAT
jgi:hypothetical protein